jgi:hypothetical protein
MRCRD